MKINKRNPTTVLNRWSHFVGVSRRAGLTVALPLFLLIAGCKKDDTTVGLTPIVAPATPVLVAPLNAAQNQATSLTLSWDASTGAGTYRLQVSTAINFATMVYNDSTITGTSKLITGLTVGTTYYWRVNAKNVAGTSAYFTRSFTTMPLQTTLQVTVNLRSTADFVILAGSLISNVPTSAITGDIGLSPAARSFITGFGLTEVTGEIYAADDISPVGVPAMLTAAKGDLTTAYNDAAGRTSIDMVLLSGNLGGLTLTPGLYKSSGSLEISAGDLTFKGDANAVFIIQIASTLNTTPGRQIILSGGAKASNIFWQVGTSATLGTTSVFKGTIMADQSISLNTGAIIEGRLFARIAAVTLKGNTIVKPAQ